MSYLEYIVGYGLAGDFGRFRASAPLSLSRSTRVLIQSERGREVGRVLRPATPRHAAHLPNSTVGQLLRPLGPEDEARAERQSVRAGELLARAGQLGRDL